MKRIIYFFIIFLTSFLYVFGQPPAPPGHRGPKKPPDEVLGPDPLHFFSKAGITLTAEQTNEIYGIAIRFVNEERSIKLEIETIDYNIRNELIKDNPDRNALRDFIRNKKELEANRDYLRILRDLDIIELLTPEQRVQLSKRNAR